MDKQTVQVRRRRFLSLVMAAVMTLGLLPLNALAANYPANKLKTGNTISAAALSEDDILPVGITISGTTEKKITVQYGTYHGGYTSLASSGYDATNVTSHEVRAGSEVKNTLGNTYWRVYSIDSTGNPIVIQLVDTYRVSLNDRGAVYNNGESDLFADYNDNYFAGSLPTPERTGYIFLGWLNSGGKVWLTDSGNEITSNETLTAAWVKLSGGSVDCGKTLAGYNPDDCAPSVTITYDDGNTDVNIYTVSVDDVHWKISAEDAGDGEGEADYFELYNGGTNPVEFFNPVGITLNGNNKSASLCTVKPVAGLPLGTYTANIEVTLARKNIADAIIELGTKFVIPVTFTVTENRSVTVNAGNHMTMATGSGAANQTVIDGSPITDVKYTADAGYHFPSDYAAAVQTTGAAENAVVNAAAVKGFKLALSSDGQLTVSGAPTADTTVTLPNATANSYAVKFNDNGATSGTMADQNFTYGAAQNLTANAFGKSFTVTYDYQGATGGNDKASDTANAAFAGWNTAVNGSGTAYTDGASVSNLTTTNNGTFNLYARWTDGAVTLPTPTKTGYTFNGWKDNTSVADVPLPLNGGDAYTPANDVTLVAQWKANSYNVAFDANGGSGGPMEDQGFDYGTAKNLTANAFTRDGYTFTGWNTAADGSGTAYADGASVSNLTATNGANVTLYAQWAKVTYTVKFDTNGGSTIADSIVASGTTAAKPADPTKDGYSFGGWYTDAACTAAYNFATPVTANLTLYAKWNAVPGNYTVTFNSNGGSAVAAQSVVSGATAAKPADPTKDGFSFGGWYTDAACTAAYNFATPVTANLTLYAKWGYTITVVIENPHPACPVTLKLMRGGVVISTATLTSGAAHFPGNLNGVYNLVATQTVPFNYTGGVNNSLLTKTTAVVVNDSSVETKLKMPANDTSSVAAVSVSGVVIGGIDALADKLDSWPWLAGKLAELGAAYALNVAHAEVNLTMNASAGGSLDTMAADVAEKLGANPTVRKLSVTVGLTVTPYDPAYPPQTIELTETLPVDLELIIPFNNGEQYFVVMREHKGSIDELDRLVVNARQVDDYGAPTTALEGWYFNKGLMSVYAKNYSGYVIGGSGAAPAPAPAPVPVPAPAPVVVEYERPDLFKVIVPKQLHGLVETSHTLCAPGTKVTLTVKPEANSKLCLLIAAFGNDNAAKLTYDKEKHTYSFEMPAYDVTVKNTFGTVRFPVLTNGTASVEYDAYDVGKRTVTLTVKPDDGYTVGQLAVVRQESGVEIPFTEQGGGVYTFEMPNGDAFVSVSFLSEPVKLRDVSDGAWYADAAQWALRSGLMNTAGDGLFDPDGVATRATVAFLLWSLEGRQSAPGVSAFTDVSDGAWYAEAIRWVSAQDLMGGYGGGLFGPEDALTREQLVTVLYRYANRFGVDTSIGESTNILSYDDAFEVSDWAIAAMQWAVGSGAVGGKTATTLNPGDTASRAELATIVMRYCESILKK